MAIPSISEIHIPFLLLLKKESKEIHMQDVAEKLAKELNLNDDDLRETILSGPKKFPHRIGWARHALSVAGWIVYLPNRHVCITDDGLKILEAGDLPKRTNKAFFRRSKKFKEYEEKIKLRKKSSQETESASLDEDATPEELIEAAQNRQESALLDGIITKVHNIKPVEFENLILKLLVAMGYGFGEDSSKPLGRSGDGGVDGVIEQDALGLDRVYIQAKRYKDITIGPEAIQAFSGSLNMHRVQKGLFVTSSSFSSKAREAAEKLTQNIVAIDGEELARLMIKHNVGVRVKTTYTFKDVDEDFFEEL